MSKSHKNESPTSKSGSKLEVRPGSLGSIGLGCSGTSFYRYRLLPEGRTQVTASLYDCIAFVIYCEEHDRILLAHHSDTTKIAWLPFVVQPEGETWVSAAHAGVNAIIGRRDNTELDATSAERLKPHYKLTYLHIERVQSSTERFYTRVTHFVHLKQSEGFKCCKDVDHLRWVKAVDVLHDQVKDIWSPEARSLAARMASKEAHITHEVSIEHALLPLAKHGPAQKLLLGAKIKAEHVIELYDDYLAHCYPAHLMSYRSFKTYLIKYGFEKTDRHLPFFFHAAQSKGVKNQVDFHEFHVALVCMEPDTDSKAEARVQFVFRYFTVDHHNQHYMTIDGFTALMQELYPKMAQNKHIFAEQVEKKATQIGIKDNKISYEDFHKAVMSDHLNIDHVCRSHKPILPQISRLIRQRHKKHKGSQEVSVSKTTISDKSCFACQPNKNFRFGAYCLTIDTIGRAVHPVLLRNENEEDDDDDDEDEMVRFDFSTEYLFNPTSVPNTMLDLIHQFYENLQDTPLIGLMASEDEQSLLLAYTKSICTDLTCIYQTEKKLIHVNSPAIVVGDIRGNLHSLVTIQKLLFTSFPIMHDNIIFLGNYHGDLHYGVECLLFVFALKLLSPNKVFLLRGLNEAIGDGSEKLKHQCLHRYGSAIGGLIHQMLWQVCEQLPFATVVDETIVCVHSGIPSKCRLEKLLELPQKVSSVSQDAFFAYEILSTYPNSKNHHKSKEDSKISSKKSKSRSDDNRYHQHIFSHSSLGSCRRIDSKTSVSKTSSSKSSNHLSSQSSGHLSAHSSGHLSSHSSGHLSAKSSGHLSAHSSGHLSSHSSGHLSSHSSGHLSSHSSGHLSTKSSGHLSAQSSRHLSAQSNRSSQLTMTRSLGKLSKESRHSLESKTKMKNQHSIKDPHHVKIPAGEIMHRQKYYDLKAFTLFMKLNQYYFLVRSQSVCSYGYKMNFRGRCLTVFSCHGLVQATDQAAVLLINSHSRRIRFLTVPHYHCPKDKGELHAQHSIKSQHKSKSSNPKLQHKKSSSKDLSHSNKH